MNWLFDIYSSVYTTAMMQGVNSANHAATAKERTHGKRSSILKFLVRR